MAVIEKLKMFAVQEPIVAASCLIGGVDDRETTPMSETFVAMVYRTGLFLPAVVRPMLDSFESSKQVRQPALNDVVAGMTGKKQ